MAIDRAFWAQRRVLITGHTGFKGAWLSLWLQSLGAQLTGLAPSSPTNPSLYELAGVGAGMSERAVDMRDADGVRDAVAHARPEVVLHLAAQPMVRRSLVEPALTYAVNVMGTVNVLEAVRQVGSDVQAVVVVTSDKCYENTGEPRRFLESDALGGKDPYSSSKACAELVAHAYRTSFFAAMDGPQVGTARAGNVIGGGDWGEDRLIPDIVRAVAAGEPIKVRNPNAVRPWQHVLNPLSGYLTLAQALCGAGTGAALAGAAAEPAGAAAQTPAAAWNFGPRAEDARTVGWIVEQLREHWGDALRWERDGGVNPPEAGYLALDSSKAERELGWRPAWDLAQALERVVQWHEAHRRGENMRHVSFEQIGQFA